MSEGEERRFGPREWSTEEEVAEDDEDEDEDGGPEGVHWWVSAMVVRDRGQGAKQETREGGDGVVIAVMGRVSSRGRSDPAARYRRARGENRTPNLYYSFHVEEMSAGARAAYRLE